MVSNEARPSGYYDQPYQASAKNSGKTKKSPGGYKKKGKGSKGMSQSTIGKKRRKKSREMTSRERTK